LATGVISVSQLTCPDVAVAQPVPGSLTTSVAGLATSPTGSAATASAALTANASSADPTALSLNWFMPSS
jgi:hypothetical protein